MCYFQEFSKVCHLSLARTRMLLVVNKVTADRSDCTLALRWELWRRGRACSELWKNTIFPEHPVYQVFKRNESSNPRKSIYPGFLDMASILYRTFIREFSLTVAFICNNIVLIVLSGNYVSPPLPERGREREREQRNVN